MISIKKKILVTGGAGFIGSHLVERLIKDGHRVTVIDNLSSGDKNNLRKMPVKFIYGDVVHLKEVKLPKFDEIYHLASLASPVFYQKYPIETILANFLGTYNLLIEAKKNKSKILFASTSEVYGNPLVHPQNENYWGNVNPIGVRACYDESKRIGETLMTEFYRQYGVEIKIARIFNTYGPRMRSDDGRVIPNFILQALKNKPITIYGKGSQTRSFCYITDLIDGLIMLMDSNFSQPVNLGNPQEITILELAKKVKEITNSKAKIIFKKLPHDDPIKRKPDISRAKKILKWEPKISLDEGLKLTIEWFKQQIT